MKLELDPREDRSGAGVIVVGNDTDCAIVIFARGELAEEVKHGSAHCDDLDLDPPKVAGLYMWEGEIENTGPDYWTGECDRFVRGSFRPLTALELFAVSRGRSPWG